MIVVFLECVKWARVSQHASFSLWVREVAFAQALLSRRGFQCLNPQILAMIRWPMMLHPEGAFWTMSHFARLAPE